MRVSKGSVIAFSAIGLAMAIWLGDIMSAWSLVAAFFVGGCFCPILYAIFFDKAKKSGLAANCAMIAGGLSGGVLELLKINVAGSRLLFLARWSRWLFCWQSPRWT